TPGAVVLPFAIQNFSGFASEVITPVVGHSSQLGFRTELAHVGVVGNRVLASLFSRLHGSSGVGVVSHHVRALTQQRYRCVTLFTWVVPAIGPNHAHLGFGVHALQTDG